MPLHLLFTGMTSCVRTPDAVRLETPTPYPTWVERKWSTIWRTYLVCSALTRKPNLYNLLSTLQSIKKRFFEGHRLEQLTAALNRTTGLVSVKASSNLFSYN